jgi:hypothetical protein
VRSATTIDSGMPGAWAASDALRSSLLLVPLSMTYLPRLHRPLRAKSYCPCEGIFGGIRCDLCYTCGMAKRQRGNADGSIYQTPDGRWRAAVLLVCGLAQEAQLQASIGSALAAAGWLLGPKGTTSA